MQLFVIDITKPDGLLLSLDIGNIKLMLNIVFSLGDFKAFRESSIYAASRDVRLNKLRAKCTECTEEKALGESQRGHMKIDLERIWERSKLLIRTVLVTFDCMIKHHD